MQGHLQSCLAQHGAQLFSQRLDKQNKEESSSHILVFCLSCPLLLLEIPKHKSHDEGSISFAMQGCALMCIQPFF